MDDYGYGTHPTIERVVNALCIFGLLGMVLLLTVLYVTPPSV